MAVPSPEQPFFIQAVKFLTALHSLYLEEKI